MERIDKRNFRPTVFLKGMAMGAADVVPGVSGGTVAFITGIYEELVDSLCQFNRTALKYFFKGQFIQFWNYINGTFLVSLFAGIFLSIFSLAKLISWVLAQHPKIIWSYFFGLILFSVFIMIRQTRLHTLINLALLILGAFLAYQITRLSSLAINPSTTFVFISGAIAICAMILPGISGSLILVILGMYQYIIEAAKLFDIPVLLVFLMGCIAGLLSFTHLLSWLLHRFRQATFALLIGFMLGSLNKVWPWKAPGDLHPEVNVLPSQYQHMAQVDPQLIPVLTALMLGILTVYLIDRMSNGRPEA